MNKADRAASPLQSTHGVGIICGLAAGAWLGGAEVPVKIASAAISPFAVSLCMVAGVFVARWTIPTVLKGSDYIFADLKENRHLIVWGALAGALWAVANTLTVFAIRDVGLSIAFPLWNTNCLVGIFWGWLLFNELRGAQRKKLAEGVRRNVSNIAGGTDAGLQFNARIADCPGARKGRNSRCRGRESDVGHNVHSLSQGVSQRHESTLIRHGVHSWRAGNDACAEPWAGRRISSPYFPIAICSDRHFLVVPRRILLGHRGPVSTIFNEICWDWPRYPSFQYESIMGARLGRFSLWRPRGYRSYASCHRHCRICCDAAWHTWDQHIRGE